jgi:hypothetical protein
MLHEIGRRLWALFHRNQFDSDLDEEMRLHRELRQQEEIERGLSPKEAHYAAQRRFGNELLLREKSRDTWGWNSVETLWQDLRYGLSQLRRSPGFTAVVIFTLAMGIGANTAVFTLMDAVILKMLPVKDPQQLVLLGWINRGKSFDITTSGYGLPNSQRREGHLSFAYPLVEELRAQTAAFSSVFGFVPTGWSKESVIVTIDGQTSMTDAGMVTGGYFSGLGLFQLRAASSPTLT